MFASCITQPEFRSSESSWGSFFCSIYKHVTPNGVKTARGG